MPRTALQLLRNCTATLVTLSGTALIAALWFRELNAAALRDAAAGSVYLFIGIGLYGRSRFTLFLAIAVCTGSLVYFSRHGSGGGPLHQLRVLADLVAILCSGWILWQLRHRPTA